MHGAMSLWRTGTARLAPGAVPRRPARRRDGTKLDLLATPPSRASVQADFGAAARDGASYLERIMSKLLRGLAAGYGAKKLGGGCFSTVLVFLLLWWLLGYCGIFQ
jgi:hypothetical protein